LRQLYSTPKHQGRQEGWQRTFYRRRRGILEHLQSGRITLFDAAVHDFILLNAQSRVNTGSSIPPGIWHGSAQKIWLLTGRQEHGRQIQRSLAKLARLGWLKRFHIQGQRGDYPILVDKFVVSDGNGNDFIVNAQETTNWQQPALIPFEHLTNDVSVKSQRNVAGVSGLLLEPNNKRNENKPITPAQAPSQEAKFLADLLKEKILKNDSKAHITSYQLSRWAEAADLLMRRDGRTEREIRDVIEWCQEDAFWKSNVLSMGKLRSKFSQLFIKQQESVNGEKSGPRTGIPRKSGAIVAPAGKYDFHDADFITSS
jgi:hypothetical protein